MTHRPIIEIEQDLRRSREHLAREPDSHAAKVRCEHFQQELQAALAAEDDGA